MPNATRYADPPLERWRESIARSSSHLEKGARQIGGTLTMKSLALIAHDNKKVDMVAWATFNRVVLGRFRLLATAHTARLLEEKVGLDVDPLLSGAHGGDAQIAAHVA